MSPGRRNPQIALRLEGNEPDPAGRWHDGAALAYLGGSLSLVLGTRHNEAQHAGDTLDLPLPPEATPRQIQDRAEAWLREQAKQILQRVIAEKSALAGRRAPRLALSFAARGHWVEAQGSDILFDIQCRQKRLERIDHNCPFGSFFLTDGSLGLTGLRTMRQTARMQGD